MKVLVVDDDLELLDLTAYALRREGFNIIAASDGAQALRRWASDHPDVVVLDATMPKMNGFEACKQIRAKGDTPIIIVTALGHEEDVVRGFQSGADDYVTKPFSHRQLAMRIRAVSRRGGQRGSVDTPTGLRLGDLILDRESHETRHRGDEIRLTPTEFRLLYVLVANVNRVVPASRLVDYAWGYDEGDESLLKTHISHIRRKLRLPGSGLGNITVSPRVGYRFHSDLTVSNT
jgi:DNA-binding response OmpR family regulator